MKLPLELAFGSLVLSTYDSDLVEGLGCLLFRLAAVGANEGGIG